MTKWVIAGLVVASVFFFAMLYVAHPEVIEAQAKKIAAPFSDFLAGREAAKYAKAREDAYGVWMARYAAPADCMRPVTTLKAEECVNQEDQWKFAFERHWQQRLDSDWKPDLG